MNKDTRIIDLTVGELEELLAAHESRLTETLANMIAGSSPSTVRGLDGIAGLLGCSRRTVARMKKSGKLDGALWQVGRTIVADRDNLLKVTNN